MLHTKTVELGTLSVLKRVMTIPEMKDFHLVGGIALVFLHPIPHRLILKNKLLATNLVYWFCNFAFK